MSTYRYSGEIRIRITYHENVGYYRCYLSVPGGVGKVVYVRERASSEVAVDSSEAFDSVARAALAFAEHEGWPVSDHAALTDCGYEISRTQP